MRCTELVGSECENVCRGELKLALALSDVREKIDVFVSELADEV